MGELHPFHKRDLLSTFIIFNPTTKVYFSVKRVFSGNRKRAKERVFTAPSEEKHISYLQVPEKLSSNVEFSVVSYRWFISCICKFELLAPY